LGTENSMGYEDKPSCLFSHYLNEDSFVALAVELGIENLLPGAEVELPVGDRDDDFVVDDQRFEVGVSVVFAGLVMLVVLPEGGERFQPLVDVFEEAALVVVDVDPGGDVHGGDQDHAVFDSGLLQGALDLRGQVDVGTLGLGVQGQVLGVEFHASTFTTGRGWQGGKVSAPPARRVQLYVQCSTWNTCAGYNVRIFVHIQC